MLTPHPSSPPSPEAPRRAPHPTHLPLYQIRLVVPHANLPPETRRRIERQSLVLGGVLVHAAEALGVALPEDVPWPCVIAPGWWFEPTILGHCTHYGLVTMPACGTLGVDLDFERGDPDFRLHGFSPQSAAVLAFHEIAHALHFMRLGPARTAAMLAAAEGNDAAMDGWPSFCMEASRILFGRDLPEGFDYARWPSRAPGSLAFVDALAGLLARHAVAPIAEAEAIDNVERFNTECERGAFVARVERLLATLDGKAAA